MHQSLEDRDHCSLREMSFLFRKEMDGRSCKIVAAMLLVGEDRYG